MASNPSRRAALAGIAGILTQANSTLRAASVRNRSLVCIRFAEPDDGAGMLASTDASTPFVAFRSHTSQQTFPLHAALSELSRLYELNSMAVVNPIGPHGGFEYLPNGFALPAWIARAAGVSMQHFQGRAFTFKTGTAMLAAGGISIEGNGFENPALLAESRRRDFGFPATSLGKQLQQVAGLLAASRDSGRIFVVSHGGASTVGDSAAQRSARFQALSNSMLAFQNALADLRLDSQVITFTDSVSRDGSLGPTLLFGPSVLGGEFYDGSQVSSESLSIALGEWAGLRVDGDGRRSVRLVV